MHAKAGFVIKNPVNPIDIVLLVFAFPVGLLDIEHRMAVTTRDAKVVLLKNGAVQGSISLEVNKLCIALLANGPAAGTA